MAGIFSPSFSRGQAGYYLADVGQRELVVSIMGQHTAPGVEDHDSLGTGFDLRVEVGDDGLGGYVEDVMHQVRATVEQTLDLAVVVRAAAFDHVAGEGPRAAGEADQRHGIVERTTDLGDGVHHVAQFEVGIGHGQIANFPLFLQRAFELRAFTFGEVQAKAHGVRHGKDVGEQDGGVEVVAGQGLQSDLAGQAGVLAQIEEAAGAFARLAVFGQVAAGLAHQPDRGVVGGLAQQRAQEGVVLRTAHLESSAAEPLRAAKAGLSAICRPDGDDADQGATTCARTGG